MLLPFYDYCERRRQEAKQRYMAEGTGIGSAFARKCAENQHKRDLEVRLYNLKSAIRIANKGRIGGAAQGDDAPANQMRDVDRMLSALKQKVSPADFHRRFGARLSELEQDYYDLLCSINASM